MADNPIKTPLPADLPSDWVYGQTVAPEGGDAGLSQQHGYNYLMQQVNAAQEGVNDIAAAFPDLVEGLSADRLVYVSTEGSDETGDGTKDNPWATVQKAVDEAPDVTRTFEYRIYVFPGEYAGFTLWTKQVSLMQYGSGTTTFNSGVTVSRSGHLDLKSSFTFTGNNALRAANSGFIETSTTSALTIQGGANGLLAIDGYIHLNTIEIHNTTSAAVRAYDGGFIYVGNLKGTGNRRNFWVTGGGIVLYNKNELDPGQAEDSFSTNGMVVPMLLEDLTNVQTAIDTHTQNAENPHAVTAAQAGARPDTWLPTAAEVGAAPTAHASEDASHGAGDASHYGHVKLSDSTSTTSGASAGIAATPTAVKAAYDLAAAKEPAISVLPITKGGTGATTAAAALSNLGGAPISHASTTTTYGSGTGSNYGHVKLSDSTSTTSGASEGTAATPTAVKAAYDLAASKEDAFSVLPVSKGGTGATTEAAARTSLGITPSNIGAAASSHNHTTSDITSGTLAIARGGTGQTTLTPAVTTKGVRQIYAGTSDMTAGTTSLTTGCVYFVYE